LDALFNLKNDPFETNNLIGRNPDRAKYKSVVDELKNDLLAWLKKNNSKHLESVKSRKIII
jgi:hypothetical protein